MTDITFNQWARSQEPGLEVLSSSTPEPVLADHNLIARLHHADVARRIVLEWERNEPADGAVGMVVLGHAIDHSDSDQTSRADPEGVTGHTARRVLKGGVPGMIIGAVLVALFVLVLDGWSEVLIGAAFGGAALGFVAGAVFSFVKGTGWGSAFEQGFVDEDAASVIYVFIHTDAPENLDGAVAAASGYEDVELFRVDRSGHRTPAVIHS